MTGGRKRAATKDGERIARLLCGRLVRGKNKLPRQVYLEDNSPAELEARRALARYLRTSRPINLGVRWAIAELIDPDCEEAERRICFKRRREGQPSRSAAADKMVAEFIRTCHGAKPIADAVAKFGLSKTSVETIWRHWQPILKRLHRTTPLSRSDW